MTSGKEQLDTGRCGAGNCRFLTLHSCYIDLFFNLEKKIYLHGTSCKITKTSWLNPNHLSCYALYFKKCSVIEVMGYEKARLGIRVPGTEGGACRFPKLLYALQLTSERPALVPCAELCRLTER